MEPRGIKGLQAQYDTSINQSLGLPEWYYHFAFNAGSVEELHAKRAELIDKGVTVTPIVDHEWVLSQIRRKNLGPNLILQRRML